MKYVVVAGGVVSGLGKGVTISSVGRLLKGCGLRVTSIKIDPYLNVDAGTMSPFEHGEVFVLGDGAESDLDLGNYERFLSVSLTSDHNVTTGKIYRSVIGRERKGDYLGKTVQVVPHITDEIQSWIERVAKVPVDGTGKEADVCLIEVGGTVGDIESSVFFEALRQFQFRVGDANFLLAFVSLVPVLSEEQKTKPTQHGVRDLRSLGLSPKVIFCRSSQVLEEATRSKIGQFCHVPPDNVLSVHDVNNVYHVPLLLMEQGMHRIIARELKLESKMELDSPDMKGWRELAERMDSLTEVVRIALIGKYTGLTDSYLSVIKSLKHASIACGRKLDIVWVEATHLEGYAKEDEPQCSSSSTSSSKTNGAATNGNKRQKTGDEDRVTRAQYDDAWSKVKDAHGVVVPGGFGLRGFEGKVLAARHCRENGVPYLGVCLGFQAMVVEYSRAVLGLDGANSAEFEEKSVNPVVFFMPEIDKENMGGTMRLGARDTTFTHKHKDGTGSVCQVLYGGAETVSERHRHRYEVNPDYVDRIHDGGLRFVGRDGDTGTRMEVAELPRTEHPYYVGCQYHPEFQSRPLKPSPPFHGLLLASCGMLDGYLEERKGVKAAASS